MEHLRADLAALTPYTVEAVDWQGEPLDKLDANEADGDVPPWFREKLAALAQNLPQHRYPDGEYVALKTAIAAYVQTWSGEAIAPNQVALGNGSDELIRSVLIAAALHRGGILVANPTFSMYGILAKSLGIPVWAIARHESDFAMDLQAAQELMARETVAAVFVVHPNSPTGNLLTAAELDWLRSLPPTVTVVVDEAYGEFADTTVVPELAAHPNWIVLRTFSKALRLAACRVGYAIAPPATVNVLEALRLPYALPVFSAEAARLALAHRETLLANLPSIYQERTRLTQTLQGWGWRVWPSAGNFVYARSGRDRAVFTELAARGTLIRHTGGGLRITVGEKPTGDRLLARLQECGWGI
ncbi:MAG TPA: histidinol-phosphate aminotransferase [Cyanobacteria bacterium UBA8156]|jgi:histidinol-phosphate aminotransferase|nr:histidinol-phosphate aminotransferase [Cyanobacteria bacterium UBA8156]